MNESWEAYLRAKFPGYLLPHSHSAHLSAEEAARFLERLTGRPGALHILRSTSFLVARAGALRSFVNGALRELVENFPARAETTYHETRGAYHGRLHVGATVALHLQGRRTSFVSVRSRRSYDLPENALVARLSRAMLALLIELREHSVVSDAAGWGTALKGCEGALRRLVTSTVLREVPNRAVTMVEENAARHARHPAYREALSWLQSLTAALAEADPERIAALVAEGGLLPLDDATRFELAVAVRLGEALERALAEREGSRWRTERGLVISGREDVFSFVRDDGLTIRLFYNQAVLPSGLADLGGRHYLGNLGRLRPDVTITFERGGRRYNAVVIECKHSTDNRVLVEGYREAVLYRWEYASELRGDMKSILVASGSVTGGLRATDQVVACDWSAWPPRGVLNQLVAYGMGGSTPPGERDS